MISGLTQKAVRKIKSMKIEKLYRQKESDLQRRLEKQLF